ncbi:SLC13 family permease [Marinospirillum minutulum]|uniref:SLC13 family permease n=1 Tax=Marinospirillum minutulum TaxID=64974 RepID=UPI0004181F9F|nr:SLC13 family permease [Marinospirillum minutulum]
METFNIWLVAGVLVGLVGTLIFTRLKPLYAFAGALLILYFSGLLPKEQLLLNFVNESVISLLLLLLTSLALEKTRFVQQMANLLLKGKERFVLFKMMTSAGLLSSVTNNTAVVATLIDPIQRNPKIPPSRLLIPLSYATILGGVLTLVGTSTNLIIDGLARKEGLPGLGFFDFTLVGLPIFFIGVLLLTLTYKLLPNNGVQAPKAASNYFTELKVLADSPLVRQTVEEAGLKAIDGLYLVELIRGDELIIPVKPSQRLREGDRLVFSGDVNQVYKLEAMPGLELDDDLSNLLERNLVEVVLSPTSTLINKGVRHSSFHSQFDATVVAVKRGNQHLSGGWEAFTLRSGDVLILAVGPEFQNRPNLGRNFVVVIGLPTVNQYEGYKAVLVAGGFFVALMAAATGVLNLLDSLLILLMLYLATGVLTATEIRRRAPFELILIIGCALGIAQVMLSSGLATTLANQIVTVFAYWGVWGALVGIYLITWLTTELITNNASAALSFPISLAIAQQFGVDPKPLLITTAFAASASFLSPYGYQTNLMVYSPGKYRYLDYVRAGLPLSIVYGIAVCALVPWFFPF